MNEMRFKMVLTRYALPTYSVSEVAWRRNSKKEKNLYIVALMNC
jgi:hypothetical protein